MSLPSGFASKYGPWAVVTGASSGIGAQFAEQLAVAGISVAIVARRQERLEALSKHLVEDYAVKTRVIVADLAEPEGRDTVVRETADLDVGLLVNNAGVELYGSFFHDPVENHQKLIDLNVSAVTALAHAFGRRLAERGRGGILFVSSIASRVFPWFSTYSASKSFVTALSLILREELGPKGIDVLSLEPGMVETEMSDRAADKIDMAKLGLQPQSAESCVSDALRSLYSKRSRVTPGLPNKISLFFMGLLPQSTLLSLMNSLIPKVMQPELLEYK